MTFYDQTEQLCKKEYIIALQNQNKGYQRDRQFLFKELSVQIHSLINHFNKLAVLIDQKNTEIYTLKKEYEKSTKSTQKSREQFLKESNIILTQQKNLGYSEQSFKQKVEYLIQRELDFKQKILLLIEKDNELKYKIQQFVQKENDLKQKDNLIQQLQKTLENQKLKYKTELQKQILHNSKQQISKLESHYNRKIDQIKTQYQDKIIQNSRKSQRILKILKQEKQKSLSLMSKEMYILQKRCEQKIKLAHKKSPQKSLNFSLELDRKVKYENRQKIKAQYEQKLKNAQQNAIQLQIKNKKSNQIITQIENYKNEKIKLIQKIQNLETKILQHQKLISDHQKQIIQKDKELKTITQELQNKRQSQQKLQKLTKSLQAKNANLNQELKRSKKSNQQIKQIANKNMKNLQKTIQQDKKQILQNKKNYLSLKSLFDAVKNQTSQKQIRIQSMQRQLQRTNNYNQILLKQNKSLNQNIQSISVHHMPVRKHSNVTPENIKSPPKNNQTVKSPQKDHVNQTKSMEDFYKIKKQINSSMHYVQTQRSDTEVRNSINEEIEQKSNNHGFSQIDYQNFTNRIENNSNRDNFVYHFNSFQTTFSPLISPGYSIEERIASPPSQAKPNILNWNPQSPINEISSLYNSFNARNQQNHELKSQQLLEKMSNLSKQKDKKQNSPDFNGKINIVLDEPYNRDHIEQRELHKLTKINPISRLGSQNYKKLYNKCRSPQYDRKLNGFADNNFYNRSSLFNKKMAMSTQRLQFPKEEYKSKR